MSGPSGFRDLSFAGAGAGLLPRSVTCSFSHCSRTVFLTDSRLLSETGCCFAQPERNRCPSFCRAASASVFWFGMVRQRAIWLRPNSARFSFSRYRNSDCAPRQSRRTPAQRQNASTDNRNIPVWNGSATSSRNPDRACLPVTGATPAPMIQPTAIVPPVAWAASGRWPSCGNGH